MAALAPPNQTILPWPRRHGGVRPTQWYQKEGRNEYEACNDKAGKYVGEGLNKGHLDSRLQLRISNHEFNCLSTEEH